MKAKIFIFFSIGLLVYHIDIGLNPDDNAKNIYISDQEITSLISAWKSQVGRNPTEDEIARIINNLIEEEILYREALLLGLDKEDRIIKRRLAQKITFLKQETLTDKPTNEALINFYELNKNNYYIQPTFSFTHYYFSAENDSKARSNAAIELVLSSSSKIKADPFFLGKNIIVYFVQSTFCAKTQFRHNLYIIYFSWPNRVQAVPLQFFCCCLLTKHILQKQN